MPFHMKNSFATALIAALLATTACAQYIEKLPLHAFFKEEVAELVGPMELIEGEYVIWRYPFRWIATGAQGERLTLTQDTPMRFVNHTQTGWEIIAKDGKQYSIATPPHIGGDSRVFYLDNLKLNGLEENIVKNRLGEPQKVSEAKSVKIYLYTKEVTRTRTGFDALMSTSTGYVGGDPFTSRTTTSVPYQESITYNPYSFQIYFDSNGKVTRVEDLCISSASWERK